MATDVIIATTLKKHHDQLLADWLKRLRIVATDGKKARIAPQELDAQAEEFLRLLTGFAASGNPDDRSSESFRSLQAFLQGISRSRVQQGFDSGETATSSRSSNRCSRHSERRPAKMPVP
jgi:hypothetical protein